MIIDAWAQHPTLKHSRDPIFDSLRRWTGSEVPTEELPVSATVALMDRARVDKALISAWEAPRNAMISNEDVAGFVAEAYLICSSRYHGRLPRLSIGEPFKERLM